MRQIFVVSWIVSALWFASPVQAQSVRISGLADLSLGNWTGSGNLSNEDTLCVYNLGNSNYQITATGSGAASAFTLSGGGGSSVAYEVYFRSNGGFVQLTKEQAQSFSGADTASSNCSGLTNATIRVVATAAAMSSVRSGSYSGTLTLRLDPN